MAAPRSRVDRYQKDTDYGELLDSLKQRVRGSQAKAMLSVNRELISFYWDIGRQIVAKQGREGGALGCLNGWQMTFRTHFPESVAFLEAMFFECVPFSRLITHLKLLHSLCEKQYQQHCHSLWQKYPGATTLCCYKS